MKKNISDQAKPENLETTSGSSITHRYFCMPAIDCFGLVYFSILFWDFNYIGFHAMLWICCSKGVMLSFVLNFPSL